MIQWLFPSYRKMVKLGKANRLIVNEAGKVLSTEQYQLLLLMLKEFFEKLNTSDR